MQNLETSMLTVKMFLFLAMELSVIVLVGGILLMGLITIVRLKIRQSRTADHLLNTRDWQLPSRPLQ